MINPDTIRIKNQKPSRFSYGYIIILVSFLILMIAWGTQFSFGVFFKPVLTEFGWTRAATSGTYSLNMVLMGASGILAGRLSDRFGPRLVITIGGLLIGLGYLLMSQVNAIWQIYLFYGVLISIGMGGMVVPLMSTSARWFVNRRGLASGIAMAGVGIGIIFTPPLANYLISSYNWRVSYIILGSISIVLIIVFAQFLKRSPGHSNTLNRDNITMKTGTNVQVHGLSLREAISTRPFWIIGVMCFFLGFGVHSVMVHIAAHATDINISTAAAATILSAIGIVSTVSKIGMGSLGDRAGNRKIWIIIFLLTSLSFIWVIFADKLWMLYLFAVIFGLGYGGSATVQSSLIADFFGLRAHGAIFGLTVFAITAGGALGSFLAGYIFDVSGSYHWAFILCAILILAGLILSIFLKPARE